MTATATKSRSLRVRYASTPLDTTVVSLTVTDAGRTDEYHVYHECDSLELTWVHDDDTSRKYTVVCSGADHKPISCGCKGWLFLRKHNRPCRHMAATSALIARDTFQLPYFTDAGHDLGHGE